MNARLFVVLLTLAVGMLQPMAPSSRPFELPRACEIVPNDVPPWQVDAYYDQFSCVKR